MTGIHNPATQHNNPEGLNSKHQCPANVKISHMETFKLHTYPSGGKVSGATLVPAECLVYRYTKKLPTYLVRAMT